MNTQLMNYSSIFFVFYFIKLVLNNFFCFSTKFIIFYILIHKNLKYDDKYYN